MSILSRVEKIDPHRATKILENSKDIQNRHVNEKHVAWMADQMKAGKWTLNGEAIILDDEEQVIDGQHRLWAIVNSGVEIESLVTRGIDRRGFATIDTGSARTTGDVLGITGEKYAMVTAAVLGWIHRHENQKMMASPKATGFSSQVAISLLRKHPGVRDAVEWTNVNKTHPVYRLVPASMLAFLRYQFAAYSTPKAEEFFGRLSDTIPDEVGSPTRILRDWILNRGKKFARQAASTLETMAIMVKFWSAFIDGIRPARYTWRRGGQYPEDFPVFPGEKSSSGKAMKIVKRTRGK